MEHWFTLFTQLFIPETHRITHKALNKAAVYDHVWTTLGTNGITMRARNWDN